MLLFHNLSASTKRTKATAIIQNQSGKSHFSLECNKIPTAIQTRKNVSMGPGPFCFISTEVRLLIRDRDKEEGERVKAQP